MPDWTADDIARQIERRRGQARGKSKTRLRTAEDEMRDWSEGDWAREFERRHGFKCDPRFGKSRVRVIEHDGAVLFDGDVREFHLTGQAHPWKGYAWFVDEGGKRRFASMVGVDGIRSASDAVTSWLGKLPRQ